MEKVYLVNSSRGCYEDYVTTVERVFKNIKDAEKYASELDKSHVFEEVFEEKVWDDIYDDFYEISDEHEEMFDNRVEYSHEKEWKLRQDEIDKLTSETLLSIAHKKGLTFATIDDINKQLEYDKHKYDEYHGSCIKEMDLY